MRSRLLACSLALLASCTTYITIVENDAGATMDTGAADAGADGGAPTDTGPCTSAASCDDGLFCNGAEQCMPTATGADLRGCVHAASPCTPTQTCDEAANQCTTTSCDMPDVDGDHHRSVACGGDDCDDADPNRFPGNPEVCDVANHDEDCDPSTFGVRDSDGDGDPDARCCNTDSAGASHCGSDCDDTRPGVSTTTPEVCNGRDDDCDGAIDEMVLVTFYLDADGDNYGTSDPAGMTTQACSQPVGYAPIATDCDDGNMTIHPGAAEICDRAPDGGTAVDENCNMMVNEMCACSAGGMRGCVGLTGLCSSGTESCIMGLWSECSIAPAAETCNGTDDDCDGSVDEGMRVVCYLDNDQDGFAPAGAVAQAASCGCATGATPRAPATSADIDCNDDVSTTHPAAVEACNGIDDDCDGVTDNSGRSSTLTVWRDWDGDTFGGGVPMMISFDECQSPSAFGFTNRGGDCADFTAEAFGGQTRYFDHPYYECPGFVTRVCTDSSGNRRCPTTPGGPCTSDLPAPAPSFDYDCDGAETPRSSPVSRIGDTCTEASCGYCAVGALLGGCEMIDFCFTGAPPACGDTTTYCTCPSTPPCTGTATTSSTVTRVVCR